MSLMLDSDDLIDFAAADRKKGLTALPRILIQAAALGFKEVPDDRR